MPLVLPVPRPHYSALLIGTCEYRNVDWNSTAAGVATAIETAKTVFCGKLEYDDCRELSGRIDQLGRHVLGWAKRREGADGDVNVVYYTGHGYVDGAGQLRLITSDIEPEKRRQPLLRPTS